MVFSWQVEAAAKAAFQERRASDTGMAGVVETAQAAPATGGFCGPSCDLSGGGGAGGSQRHGGSGGSAGGCWAECGVTGSVGLLRDGGAGGDSNCGYSCSNGGNGGGGGGGYYGGGGGGGGGSGYGNTGGFWPAGGGGGGGGSWYVETETQFNVQMWQGWRNATGNGLMLFSW